MEEADRRGIPFAVGGGLTAMTYAGQWRNTKDMDLYILPADRDRMISVVLDSGLRDYYERLPYDRNWIFRSYKDDIVVDLMWAMANQRAQVDESWFRGPTGTAGGLSFRLLAPEEEIWSKLYVLQRDRCDWPDVFVLLRARGPELDWRHLLDRLGPDKTLLSGLLRAYCWLAPDDAMKLPDWIWSEVESARTDRDGRTIAERARLLDSRLWLG